MSIAVHWYASGIFWGAAGVVVTVLLGAATILVTYIVGFPRRRLLYGMPVVATMLTAPVGVQGNLELRHRGTVLTAPHVLEIRLVSRGRKDIPSSAYDGDKPLLLDVGAHIVEVLHVTSEPPSSPAPKWAVDGTTLSIGPSLISKQQKIDFTLLTDGGKPSLTCQSSLIDVQVREQGPEDIRPAAALVVLFAAVTLLATIAMVWSLAAASTHRSAAATAGAGASTAAAAAARDESSARTAARQAVVAEQTAVASLRQASMSAAKGDLLDARIATASADTAKLQETIDRSATIESAAAADHDTSTATALSAVQASAMAAAQEDALRVRASGAGAAVSAVAAIGVGTMLLRRWSRR